MANTVDDRLEHLVYGVNNVHLKNILIFTSPQLPELFQSIE